MQRASVRINLDGDVPSVPIPPHKRKPSLKQPLGGHRGSLLAPEKTPPKGSLAPGKRGAEAVSIHASGTASRDPSLGYSPRSYSRATIAEILLGQKRGGSVRRAGSRCAAGCAAVPARESDDLLSLGMARCRAQCERDAHGMMHTRMQRPRVAIALLAMSATASGTFVGELHAAAILQ